MNRAGQGQRGRVADRGAGGRTADGGTADGGTADGGTADGGTDSSPTDSSPTESSPTESSPTESSGTTGSGTTGTGTGSARLRQPDGPSSPQNARLAWVRAGWARADAAGPAARHLGLLVVYLAAGIALTWPRTTYLFRGTLPRIRDASGYVWDLWWFTHQITHLANPFYTGSMAAPFGIQLGFDTTMPLAGLVMTPVTLAFGPSASFSLLTIVAPGLACYLMYRAARLWLAGPGAVAAGALFGLSSMLAWQDWYHLNIALGTLFLPLTLETAVRLGRAPTGRRGLLLGLVLGACVLVNQESAVMAVVLAAVLLLPRLARRPRATLMPLAVTAGAAALVASPQLAAMAQQAVSGGTTVNPHLLAHTGVSYGVGPANLFGPSPRVAAYDLTGLAAAVRHSGGHIGEGMPMFGVVLTVLALCGLAVSWRRGMAWLLAALWLVCAGLALGPTLWAGGKAHEPVPAVWHGEPVSLLLPYTWLMRVPLLSDLREADRFALLGLVGAALLAGLAVDWLRRRARAAIPVMAALAVLEAGWWSPGLAMMPTTFPAVDRAIAADHSGSVVVDVPFGMRGGIPLYGAQIPPPALVMATNDGHPRAESYTSWVPAPTIRDVRRQIFYRLLIRAQHYEAGKPLNLHATPAQLAQARQNARNLHLGWVVVWTNNPQVARYLTMTGFRLDYRVGGTSVYRPVT